jgi:hypothetical protein
MFTVYKYTIKGVLQEGNCRCCGWYLTNGETAVEHAGYIYCSQECARDDWKIRVKAEVQSANERWAAARKNKGGGKTNDS